MVSTPVLPPGLDEAWSRTADRLAGYLVTMEADDRLTLHALGCDAAPIEVEVTRDADGVGWSTRWGEDAYTVPPASPYPQRAAAVWEAAVRVLRTLHVEECVLHPSLITVSGDGPATAGLGLLRLTRHDDVGDDVVRPPRSVSTVGQVRWPGSQGDLARLVHDHLRDRHPDAALGPQGALAVEVDGVSMIVSPMEGRAMLMIMARCADDVRLRMSTDIELNILNRHHAVSRWVRRGREVWQEITLHARPFCPAVLDRMLEEFADDWLSTHEDLMDRLGRG